MHKKILRTVLLLAIIISMLSPASCTTKNNTELGKIKYGGQYFPEEFLLKGYDFWSRYSIQVEHILFKSSAENNAALITGAADIIISSPEKSIAVFDELGEKAVIIAVSERGNRYSTVIRDGSGITNWDDLVGQKIGIRLKTGTEQVMREYFDHTPDLNWDDFKWVNLRVEDMAAALQDGSIAAFTAWEPFPAAAQAAGGVEVMKSYGDISQMPVLILTTAKFAKSHRDELTAFLRGHLDKLALINSNTEQAADIASETAAGFGYNYPSEVFKIIFKRISFALEIDDDMLSSLEDTAQFLVNTGSISEIPPLNFDASFLEAAMQKID